MRFSGTLTLALKGTQVSVGGRLRMCRDTGSSARFYSGKPLLRPTTPPKSRPLCRLILTNALGTCFLYPMPSGGRLVRPLRLRSAPYASLTLHSPTPPTGRRLVWALRLRASVRRVGGGLHSGLRCRGGGGQPGGGGRGGAGWVTRGTWHVSDAWVRDTCLLTRACAVRGSRLAASQEAADAATQVGWHMESGRRVSAWHVAVCGCGAEQPTGGGRGGRHWHQVYAWAADTWRNDTPALALPLSMGQSTVADRSRADVRCRFMNGVGS